MFKANNKYTRKTPITSFSIFVFVFVHISHLFLGFLLFTLNS